MRLIETRLIAARELREAYRSRWFLLTTGCFLLLSLGLSYFGLAVTERSGLAGFDRTTASMLNLVLLFVPLVTLSIGSLNIAGELEDGSLGMLLSQPVSRAEVYAGKFLGLLTAVALSIFAGFGVSGVAMAFNSGGNVKAYLILVGFTLLLAASTLAFGTLLSVLLRSRAKVIGAAFTAWIFFVYVSDLGTIGLAIARNLEPGQIFTLALFNPVQQARLLGTMALTSRLEFLGPVGVFGLDHFGANGLPALLCLTLLLSALLPLLLAFQIFRKAVVP
jgi:Cu-processing system permease protein